MLIYIYLYIDRYLYLYDLITIQNDPLWLVTKKQKAGFFKRGTGKKTKNTTQMEVVHGKIHHLQLLFTFKPFIPNLQWCSVVFSIAMFEQTNG